MTRNELLKAIEETKQEIYRIQEKLDQATDPREEKRLLARLKEMQYLQLWHIEQMERIKYDGIT